MGGLRLHLSIPGVSLIALGALAVSVCPANECDMDTFFSTNSRARVLLALMLMIQSGLAAMWAPHAHMISCVVSFWAAGSGEKADRLVAQFGIAPPQPTTLFCAWMLSENIAYATRYAYYWGTGHAYDLTDTQISTGATYYIMEASIFCVPTLLLCFWLVFQRHRFRVTNSSEGSSPTLALYQCLSGYMSVTGLAYLGDGAYLTSRGNRNVGLLNLLQAVIILLPSVVVVIVGRDRMFRWVARQFERQWASSDGSTVISLLIDQPPTARVGKTWWIVAEAPPNEAGPNDAATTWQRGAVTNVDSDGSGFEIALEASEPVEQPPSRKVSRRFSISDSPVAFLHQTLIGAVTPTAVLIDEAKNALRCVDWADMSEALLAPCKPSSSNEARCLSRPVARGETIDFFVSHAFLDDAGTKFSKLKLTAAFFRKEHGREPTFWLESACLGTHQLGGALRVLPVHIEACTKMLVVASLAYSKDLRCVLELYTLFALAETPRQASERLDIIELDGRVLRELETFRIDEETTCEDPNEETELRAAIRHAGVGGFIKHIRRHAFWCRSSSAGHAMARFKSEREHSKRRLFRRVMKIGTRFITLGIFLIFLSMALQVSDDEHLIVDFLRLLGEAWFVFGVIIVSTCPLEANGLDVFFKRKLRERILFFSVITAWMISETVLRFPHLHIFAACLSAWAIIRGHLPSCLKKQRPLVSTLVCISLPVSCFASGVHHLLIAAVARRETMAESDETALSPSDDEGNDDDDAARGGNPVARGAHLTVGVVQTTGGVLLFLWWRLQRKRFDKSYGRFGADPTLLVFQMLYGLCLMRSSENVIHGFSLASTSYGTAGMLTVFAGFLQAFPPLLVYVIGRQRVFTFMATRFERAHAVHDGAFIAQLLDTAVACEGDTWWVHRDAPNTSFDQFDPRRNWQQGVVETVRGDEMVVVVPAELEERRQLRSSLSFSGNKKHQTHRLTRALSGKVAPELPPTRHNIKLGNSGMAADELMSKAVSELRCIEWSNFSRELLTSSISAGSGVTSTDLFKLSRPVKPGEQVDFFMSHSCEYKRRTVFFLSSVL